MILPAHEESSRALHRVDADRRIKKNGQWVISISYQTTIQAAPAMAS